MSRTDHRVPLIARLLRRRVPVRLQAQVSDCGAACLAMVLAYHGSHVPLDRLRARTDTGRAGVSARVLLTAGRQCGLVGKGVRVPPDGLRNLPAASILVWESQHYVVLEKVAGQYVYVVDPAVGRRRVEWQRAVRAFSGVALVFSPAPDAPPAKPSRSAARHVDRWRLLRPLMPGGRRWALVAATCLGLLPFRLGLPLAVTYAIGQLPAGRTHVDLARLLLALGAACLGYALAEAGRGLAAAVMQPVAADGRTLGLLRHVFSLPFGYFGVRKPEDLAWRLRGAMVAVENATSSAVLVLADGLLLLGLSALMVYLDPLLASLVLAAVCAQAGVATVAANRQRYLDLEIQQRQARGQQELADLFEGITTITSAGLGQFAATRAAGILDAEITMRTRRERQAASWSAAGAALHFFAPWAVLVVGSAKVATGALSIGAMAGLTVAALQVFTPLASLLAVARQAGVLRVAADQVADVLLETPRHRAEATDGRRELAGSLRLQEVDFRHPGATTNALSGVELTASAGSVLTVAGPPGSGKSTIALLIAGLLTPTGGTVLLDGTDLADLDARLLAKAVALVDSKGWLFAGSIRDNIARGADVTEQQIAAVARLVEVDKQIAALPLGYDTVVDPGGTDLPGEQRQRIALAAALLRAPKLLILDEAMSELDADARRRLLGTLRDLDCTVIICDRSPAGSGPADQVLTLDGGRPGLPRPA